MERMGLGACVFGGVRERFCLDAGINDSERERRGVSCVSNVEGAERVWCHFSRVAVPPKFGVDALIAREKMALSFYTSVLSAEKPIQFTSGGRTRKSRRS